ncbi:hypothetical protein PR048_011488 [Dryococelus australis]|uniref:Uncharacterized protein n=1 Tax=Dryococelus australis TaxID=614101 RepID=A0ABQ9HMG3_9NEOP|nr:hypothetical protein PR048_011488 [Dryococelus australis]
MIVKVSKLLQDPNLDILTAMGEVRHLRSSLQDMRSDDKYFNETYDAVLKHCEENEVEVSSPKRKNVSRHLDEN